MQIQLNHKSELLYESAARVDNSSTIQLLLTHENLDKRQLRCAGNRLFNEKNISRVENEKNKIFEIRVCRCPYAVCDVYVSG